MKRQRLKSVVFLLFLFCFIGFASAGNVIFRDGKIISSGNVSTDEKFVGDGSKITNLSSAETDPRAYNGTLAYNSSLSNYRTLTNQNFNSTVAILGDPSNAFAFSNLLFYQNISSSQNGPLWQFSHRSESAIKNALTYHYYNGSNWFLPFIILSNLNVGIGTSTPSEKLEVNGNIKASGNITANGGKFIGDGSLLTNLPSSNESDPKAYNGTLAYNSSFSNYRTLSNNEFNGNTNVNANLTISGTLTVNQSQGYVGGNIHLLNNANDANNYNTINLFSSSIVDWATNSIWALGHRRSDNALIFTTATNGSYTTPFQFYKSGGFNATGNITANTYFGSGAQLTDIPVRNIFNQTLNTTSDVKFGNVTSNHQTYNISASLDTTYTNQHERPIRIDFSIESNVQGLDDTAIVLSYANGIMQNRIGIERFGHPDGEYAIHSYSGSFTVQPSNKWSLNTSVAGNGVLGLWNGVRVTVL